MIGPSLVIVFMILMSLLAYWGFSTQKGSLDNIFNERFDGYKKSAKILVDMNVIYADVYRVISWTHAKYDQKKIDDLIRKQIPAIDNSISFVSQILQSPALLPEEKKLYQDALEQLNNFKQPVAGFTDLVKTDIFSATMFLGTADEAFQELNKTLQALMVIEDKLSKEDYDQSIKKYLKVLTIFAIILAFAVVISLIVSFMVARMITTPIHQSIGIVQEIATGDLTQELKVESSDEIGELAQSVDTMRLKISEAVSQSVSMSQILAEGASQQASSVEETSAAIEELSAMTKQNADNASQVNSLMMTARQMMDKANTSMTDLTFSMQGIDESSAQTQKIVKTIDEIAFQTNLLALNAAVEAARAAESAKSTSGLIDDIVKKIKGGADLVNATNTNFSELNESISKVKYLVEEIAAASKQQSQGIDQINKAVSEIDKTTQQNAASAEELAAVMAVFRTKKSAKAIVRAAKQKILLPYNNAN